jgi:hypothetical protein
LSTNVTLRYTNVVVHQPKWRKEFPFNKIVYLSHIENKVLNKFISHHFQAICPPLTSDTLDKTDLVGLSVWGHTEVNDLIHLSCNPGTAFKEVAIDWFNH